MGFHAVAIGVEVTPHNDSLEALLNLIAVQGTWTITGETVRFLLHDDLQCDDLDYDNEEYCDISMDELWMLKFDHVTAPWIKFGNPHCCTYMMYIACVGDDLGGEKAIVEVSDESLMTFIRIKNDLTQAGRLPLNSKLVFKPNCCS